MKKISGPWVAGRVLECTRRGRLWIGSEKAFTKRGEMGWKTTRGGVRGASKSHTLPISVPEYKIYEVVKESSTERGRKRVIKNKV